MNLSRLWRECVHDWFLAEMMATAVRRYSDQKDAMRSRLCVGDAAPLTRSRSRSREETGEAGQWSITNGSCMPSGRLPQKYPSMFKIQREHKNIMTWRRQDRINTRQRKTEIPIREQKNVTQLRPGMLGSEPLGRFPNGESHQHGPKPCILHPSSTVCPESP